MRWLTFLILLYVFIPLQRSHLGALPSGPHGDIPWPAIEFIPMLAIFYALFAEETSAAFAALACGVAYDISNGDYIGTNMIPLALSVLLLFRIRSALFRERPLTHALVTLQVMLTFAVLSPLTRRILGAPLAGGSILSHLFTLVANAFYSAAVAPAFFWLLFRLRKILGFPWRRRHL